MSTFGGKMNKELEMKNVTNGVPRGLFDSISLGHS